MINRWLYVHFPTIRQIITRVSYDWVTALDRDQQLLCLNYGYVDLDSGSSDLQLTAQEELCRYEIQLYHHIATAVPLPWQELEVLEVSSGRGGGASYLKKQLQPKRYTALDFSRPAVKFCHSHYKMDGLSFLQGNAEALDFPDSSFDVVSNIEASFYYPHIERFLKHVVRVLRPHGHFFYADMRYVEELQIWRQQLSKTGLILLCEEDITRNVREALALSRERRSNLVREYVPRVLQRPFADLGGVTGAGLSSSAIPKAGERVYKSFVFQKRAPMPALQKRMPRAQLSAG